MASNFKISTAARNAACNAIVDLVDTSAPGSVKIYTGAPPATPATAASGTLLGTCPMASPNAFGNASTGQATANGITSDASADASGDAGYFRVLDGAGTVIFQGTAGEAADSADMTFDVKAIVYQGTIAISSMTVTVPEQ